MEARVSRKDLFDEPSSPELLETEPIVSLEFEEIAVKEEISDGDDVENGGFQLFGGQTMTIDLNADDDEALTQKRPDCYYFAVSGADRDRCTLVAVTGDQILAEAARDLALAAMRPPAPDINAGWTKPRRKCRPGKAARKQRKERNIRFEKERKEEQQRWRNARKRPFRR